MHKKYCQTNKSNVVTYSSQIRPVRLDLSSKSFSKVSSPRQLRRGTSICPAVLASLSTGADEGKVVLYLMKAFRTFGYLFSILRRQGECQSQSSSSHIPVQCSLQPNQLLACLGKQRSHLQYSPEVKYIKSK